MTLDNAGRYRYITGMTNEDRWHKAAAESLDAMYKRAVAAEAEAERLRGELKRIHDREPSSGPDYTPNVIAGDALKNVETAYGVQRRGSSWERHGDYDG